MHWSYVFLALTHRYDVCLRWLLFRSYQIWWCLNPGGVWAIDWMAVTLQTAIPVCTRPPFHHPSHQHATFTAAVSWTGETCLSVMTIIEALPCINSLAPGRFGWNFRQVIISPVSKGSGDVMVLCRSRPPPAARHPPPAARRPPPAACNGVNAITQKPLDGLFSNLVYTLVVIVSWPD